MSVEAQIVHLLEPSFRLGDKVAIPSRDVQWGTITSLTEAVATLECLDVDGKGSSWTTTSSVELLHFVTGSPHLSRRPAHPRCLDPECIQPTGADWIVIHGWPNIEEQRGHRNWRWVQSCAGHRDLAEAWMTDWVGTRGLIRREDGTGRSLPAPTLAPPALGPSLALGGAEQGDLFAYADVLC